MNPIEAAKHAAARAALEHVSAGMRLGLGTGSTTAHFIALLGARVREGLGVQAVATSRASEALAREAGVALFEPGPEDRLDLCVDGADEIGPDLALIKGGGGALLREKIVAAAAGRFLVIADAGKLVSRLGRFALPVEISPFTPGLTIAGVKEVLAAGGLGHAGITVRHGGDGPALSDGGNLILDIACTEIPDPAALDAGLNACPGVMEHGLFIGMADLAILGAPGGGSVQTLRR